ncbi:MAG: hypothetical protein OJF55_001346 [Rhodanobacteraceae bacterium]|jgi:membrane protease YdiL (CAAX protease family)|nr:MAG: hypothetical protein OJF55_001346 [Rhodanobacteraceae bacterium]
MDLPTENTPAVPAAAAAVQTVEKRPGVWSGLGIVALYFLLQFGLGILAGMAIGVVLGIKAGLQSAAAHRTFDPQSLVRLMQANPDIRAITAVLTIAAAAAVMTAIVRQTWPAQWARAELPGFGLTRPNGKYAYLGAVLLALLVLMVGNLMTHLLAGSHPIRQDVTLLAGNVSPGLRMLLALLVVGVAPFVEELVFRGVLLSGLASRMHIGWAVVLSALVFGCVHLPDFKFAWYPVPALVLLGVASAWLRLKTRSLWPSITLHATNNLVAAIAWFVAAHH